MTGKLNEKQVRAFGDFDNIVTVRARVVESGASIKGLDRYFESIGCKNEWVELDKAFDVLMDKVRAHQRECKQELITVLQADEEKGVSEPEPTYPLPETNAMPPQYTHVPSFDDTIKIMIAMSNNDDDDE